MLRGGEPEGWCYLYSSHSPQLVASVQALIVWHLSHGLGDSLTVEYIRIHYMARIKIYNQRTEIPNIRSVKQGRLS